MDNNPQKTPPPDPARVAEAVKPASDQSMPAKTPSLAGEAPTAAHDQEAIKARQSRSGAGARQGITAPPITPPFNGASKPPDPFRLTPVFNAAAQPPPPPADPKPRLNFNPPLPPGPGGGTQKSIAPVPPPKEDPANAFRKKMLMKQEFNRRARDVGRDR